MKYNIFRISSINLIIFGTILFILIFLPGQVSANAPGIKGHVYKKATTQPLDKSVWIKWVDSNGSIRYAQTKTDGSFRFPGWQSSSSVRSSECTTKIDINYDGTVDDTKMAYVNKSDHCSKSAFGCGENPHTWTVVPRPEMNGKFTSETRHFKDPRVQSKTNGSLYVASDDWSNVPGDVEIGLYYWEDFATPTPSPTKIPCGNPCTGPVNQPDSQCDLLCPICAPGPNPGQNICTAPSPTPSPTLTPSPTPTKVPCGGPCNKNDECVIECPICAPGPNPGQNICLKPPTPTPTHPCDP